MKHGEKIMQSDELVSRLRGADRNSVQRSLGSRIFGEAADEIERLRALSNSVVTEAMIEARAVEILTAAHQDHDITRGIHMCIDESLKAVKFALRNPMQSTNTTGSDELVERDDVDDLMDRLLARGDDDSVEAAKTIRAYDQELTGERNRNALAIPADVIRFLRGEGSLDGRWFGDKVPLRWGTFWWRKYLPALNAIATPDTDRVAVLDIGDRVECVTDNCDPKWAGDWIDWQGFIAGAHYEPRVGLNYTVSDHWPPRDYGDLSDGFREGQLRRAALSQPLGSQEKEDG